jgi:type II secretory pathway pseudopilin PulG
MRRERAGFTVLEAAVALAIVGVSAIGVLSSIGAQARGLEHARAQLEASMLAQRTLTRLQTIDRGGLDPLPDSLRKGRFDPPFETYDWESSVTPVPNETDLLELRVVVHGAIGEFELRTRRHLPPRVAVAR